MKFGKSTVWIPAMLLAFATFVGSVTAQQGPVEVTAAVNPVAGKDSHYQVVVKMQIEDGWHAYAHIPDGEVGIVTRVKFDLPSGVKSVGKMKVSDSTPSAKNPAIEVYEGTTTFTQMVKVGSGKVEGGKASVFYQICNDKMCRPPTTKKVKFAFPAVKVKASGKVFDQPEMLMVGKSPLNKAARQMYPSPAVFDVDGDGAVELVVGDIFGSLNVYENENAGKSGDPVWAKHRSLESFEGKKIKVSNW